MEQKLPTLTPEQSAFNRRRAHQMVPLINAGTDLREAERLAAQMVADEMRQEGHDEKEVDSILKWANDLAEIGVNVSPNGTPVSFELFTRINKTFEEEIGSSIELLVEKLVKTPTGYTMFVFPNESKHPGRPHLTVQIGDKNVNISISETPEVLAGDAHQPGISAILKAVKRNCKALKKEWYASRPDDQKLKNFKSRKITKNLSINKEK